MKKTLISSVVISIVLIASLGFLFLEDYNNNDHYIVHQLDRDGIKALVMLTIDNDWGNQQSASITESFLIDGMAAPKIEIKFDPENSKNADISYNVRMAIEEHLKTFQDNEVVIIFIGMDGKQIINTERPTITIMP